jgi:tetratricopeptide (TPR) repeat protein
MRNFLAFFVVVVALSGPARVRAAAPTPSEKEQAKAAYGAGITHFNLNEYAEALTSFKEAYRHYPDPVFLFNIAQCHRLLGNKQEAVRSYRSYLRTDPNAANAAEVQQIIASLERALKEEQAAAHHPPQGPLLTSPEGAPPPGEASPARPSEAPAATLAVERTSPVAASRDQPVYKKWWLWAAVGGVVAVGLGVGLGVGLTQGPSFPSADGANTTVRF